MQEFKIGVAIVRIHGNCSQDTIRSASVRFMKKAIKQKKEKKAK